MKKKKQKEKAVLTKSTKKFLDPQPAEESDEESNTIPLG